MAIIPWIGYDICQAYMKMGIERDFGVDAPIFRNAKEGLEATLDENHDIILVNYEVLPGLELKERNPQLVACYVIEQLRKSVNADTPIIVPHHDPLAKHGMLPSEIYNEAGATELFDAFHKTPTDFVKVVGKYL